MVAVGESIGVRVILGRCRLRLCPTCQRLRASALKRRIEAPALKADQLRLITLTFPDDGRPLAERMDEAASQFKRWRRARSTTDHIRGGFAVWEVTRNPATGTWHPHIHIIAEGTYWRQADLLASWAAVCPGAKIVDVRAVHSRIGAAQYVAKYVSKGTELGHWPPEDIREYADAMHRRRLAYAFGSWHHLPDEPEELEVKDVPPDAAVVSLPLLCDTVGEQPSPLRTAAVTLAKARPMFRLILWSWWNAHEQATMNDRPTVDEVDHAASLLCDALKQVEEAIIAGITEPQRPIEIKRRTTQLALRDAGG